MRRRGWRTAPRSQRYRGRNATHWYHNLELPTSRDLVHLRPPKLNRRGKNRGFETEAESAARDQVNIKILRRGGKRANHLADKLDECSRDAPCGSAACKKCMRQLRRALTGITVGQARRYRKARLAPYLLTLVWTDSRVRSQFLPARVVPELD